MSAPPCELLVVMCTFPSAEAAASIGKTLVEERLCACINLLGPVRSIYRYRDQLQDDTEVLGLLKTPADRFDALSARLRALHPYEVPEIVALSAPAVSDSYLAWAVAETRPTEMGQSAGRSAR